jgi:hypothetical protein
MNMQHAVGEVYGQLSQKKLGISKLNN